jgi:hypothetical protein
MNGVKHWDSCVPGKEAGAHCQPVQQVVCAVGQQVQVTKDSSAKKVKQIFGFANIIITADPQCFIFISLSNARKQNTLAIVLLHAKFRF